MEIKKYNICGGEIKVALRLPKKNIWNGKRKVYKISGYVKNAGSFLRKIPFHRNY